MFKEMKFSEEDIQKSDEHESITYYVRRERVKKI